MLEEARETQRAARHRPLPPGPRERCARAAAHMRALRAAGDDEAEAAAARRKADALRVRDACVRYARKQRRAARDWHDRPRDEEPEELADLPKTKSKQWQRDLKLHAAQSEILSLASATLADHGATIDCDAPADARRAAPARKACGEVDFLAAVEARLDASADGLRSILDRARAKLDAN